MTTPTFRPPRQMRSQATLDRILDSAERVLDAKSFSESTVAEMMQGAGLTVGAFYRRFADKDALLHLLDERFFDEIRKLGDELLAEERWRGATVADVLSAFAAAAVGIYTVRRGIIRSLFLRARVDPVIQATARQLNTHLISQLRVLLGDASRRHLISHTDPDRAIALGFMMFVGALRETTVFGETWPDHQALVSGDLQHELARSYISYLCAQSTNAQDSALAASAPLAFGPASLSSA